MWERKGGVKSYIIEQKKKTERKWELKKWDNERDNDWKCQEEKERKLNGEKNKGGGEQEIERELV